MRTDALGVPELEVPAGWNYAPLGNLIDEQRGISYGIVQQGQHVDDGVPILRVNNLRGGRILTDDVLQVGTEIEANYLRTRLRGGEVLLSLVGTLGECAIVPNELAGWNVARAVAVIPLKANIDPYWVAMCLRSADVQALVRAWATTTVQATLNLRDVRRLPVLLAPEPDRTNITRAIRQFDDKLEQNRRTGRALEGLAQATFKAWFVDFEPIKAKAAGAAGYPGMPHAAFAALPGRLTDSRVGPVPEGWEVRSLSKAADFLNGLALQKYPPAGQYTDLPVIKIAELRKGSTEGSDLANANVPDAYVIEDGDLLFSWSGTLEAEFWFGGRGALNQHLFKVTSDDYPRWLCLNWVRQHLPEFRLIASSKATTMGHIKRGHLDDAQVVVPDEESLHAADDVTGPLYDLHACLALETRKLAALRDYLLPRLLSGRVRPPHGEVNV